MGVVEGILAYTYASYSNNNKNHSESQIRKSVETIS